MRYCFLFGFLLILASCTSNEKNTENKPRLHWQSFSLTLEDTAVVIGSIMSDSIEIRNRNNQTKFYFIGKSGRDSLFSWANELMTYTQPKKLILVATMSENSELKSNILTF